MQTENIFDSHLLSVVARKEDEKLTSVAIINNTHEQLAITDNDSVFVVIEADDILELDPYNEEEADILETIDRAYETDILKKLGLSKGDEYPEFDNIDEELFPDNERGILGDAIALENGDVNILLYYELPEPGQMADISTLHMMIGEYKDVLGQIEHAFDDKEKREAATNALARPVDASIIQYDSENHRLQFGNQYAAIANAFEALPSNVALTVADELNAMGISSAIGRHLQTSFEDHANITMNNALEKRLVDINTLANGYKAEGGKKTHYAMNKEVELAGVSYDGKQSASENRNVYTVKDPDGKVIPLEQASLNVKSNIYKALENTLENGRISFEKEMASKPRPSKKIDFDIDR